MAVTIQEQVGFDAVQAARPSRVAWPKSTQLGRSLPIFRLLAAIWAIPEVRQVGLLVEGLETHLRVVVPDTDREVWSRIFQAESQYLNGTTPHMFELQIVPLSKAPVAMPPPFETILER